MDTTVLAGFRIGITGDRRWEEQAELLTRRGATVLHGPVIRVLGLGPEDGLRAATEALVARRPEYLVAMTGIGIRTWLGAAAVWGLEAELLEALAGARMVARGPKAVGALAAVGLDTWWQAPGECSDEITARLLGEGVAGRRIAIQLHGADLPAMRSALAGAGAEVVELPVYRWTLPEDRRPAEQLIEAACTGELDAITFTTAPAIGNLLAIAEERGAAEDLRAALSGPVTVACVGPLCADAARQAGVPDPVVPERARLGTMVRALTERLAGLRHVVRVDDRVEVILQGSVVTVGDQMVRLGRREAALLRALLERPGTVVPRSLLVSRVWGSADDHLLAVTMSRLRRRLEPAGLDVRNLRRRGYRLAATPARTG